MSGPSELAALSWEAHRRGMTYGELMSHTTLTERESICLNYAAEKRREEQELKKQAAERAAGRKKKKRTASQ